jgi:hypothetical protein
MFTYCKSTCRYEDNSCDNKNVIPHKSISIGIRFTAEMQTVLPCVLYIQFVCDMGLAATLIVSHELCMMHDLLLLSCGCREQYGVNEK